MKRFKSKKRKKRNYKLYCFFIIISFLLSLLFFNKTNSDKIISFSLDNLTNNMGNIIDGVVSKIASPPNIIYASLNKKVKKDDLSVFKETDDEYNYENTNTSYVEDPNPVKVSSPIVYIYNTHQLEEYSSDLINDYNIRPNVLMASYVLKEKLIEKDIETIVETANIKQYMTDNSWKYSRSYRASRHFYEIAKSKNKTLNYFIDVHRDSVGKDATTVVKGKVKYAKVMFIVGLEHDNYKKNLALAEDINYRMSMKLPGISRGISKKSGPNVNGIYNQDLHPNTLLIEVGGVENSIEEVYNTMEILATVLSEKIEV